MTGRTHALTSALADAWPIAAFHSADWVSARAECGDGPRFDRFSFFSVWGVQLWARLLRSDLKFGARPFTVPSCWAFEQNSDDSGFSRWRLTVNAKSKFGSLRLRPLVMPSAFEFELVSM
jgi:hypothetical protein